MDLGTAQGLFAQALQLKQQYESYLSANPGATEGNSVLGSLHQQALAIKAQLRSGGYSEAADVLAGEDLAGSSAWAAATPDLGNSAASSGVSTTTLGYTWPGSTATAGVGPIGAAQQGQGGQSSGTSGSEGFLGWLYKLIFGSGAQGLPAQVGGTAGQAAGQAVGQALGTAAEETIAGAGAGAGQAAMSLGKGVGAGFGAAAQQAVASLTAASRNLLWPVALILGLVVFGRVYRIRVNKGAS